jgi:hypothetical protein
MKPKTLHLLIPLAPLLGGLRRLLELVVIALRSEEPAVGPRLVMRPWRTRWPSCERWA